MSTATATANATAPRKIKITPSYAVVVTSLSEYYNEGGSNVIKRFVLRDQAIAYRDKIASAITGYEIRNKVYVEDVAVIKINSATPHAYVYFSHDDDGIRFMYIRSYATEQADAQSISLDSDKDLMALIQRKTVPVVQPSMPSPLPMYGESLCSARTRQGGPCTNMAYYITDQDILCGVHSKSHNRVTLPKNPNHKQDQMKLCAARMSVAAAAAAENKKNGRYGEITVSKMHMIKKVTYIDSYVNVYPNFKHAGRRDGWGMHTLSPKFLGPVEHVMTCLPPALNLENYHQYAKFWSFELDKDDMPTAEAHAYRCAGYESSDPRRHKHDPKKLKEHSQGNVPKFSLYYNKDGQARKYTYLECRYFYCYYYTLLTREEPEFLDLVDKVMDGYNINIVGYDGYKPTELYEMYIDTTRPFGHEMVLYALLLSATGHSQRLPWEVFREEHPELYVDMF